MIILNDHQRPGKQIQIQAGGNGSSIISLWLDGYPVDAFTIDSVATVAVRDYLTAVIGDQ